VPGAKLARRPEHLAHCACGNPQHYDPGRVYSGLLIGTPREAALLLHELMTGPLLSERPRATMPDRRVLDVPLQGSPWETTG